MDILIGEQIQRLDGLTGVDGEGPCCWDALIQPGPDDVLYTGSGGRGANGRNAPQPLPVTTGVRGAGGKGNSPGSNDAESGQSGRVRFFWN
jgi:hypothetical protein